MRHVERKQIIPKGCFLENKEGVAFSSQSIVNGFLAVTSPSSLTALYLAQKPCSSE